MRITAIIIITGFLQLSAHSNAQDKISLSENKASLEKVFRDIQKQTNYIIWFDKALLQYTSPVSLEIKNETLERVLELSCRDQPVVYSIVGYNVVIRPRPAKNESVFAGSLDVRGRVLNEKSEAIPGVSVTVKNRPTGTITELDGSFFLPHIDSNAILVFGGANVEPHQENLNGRTEIVVMLKSRINKLDEIQIIGYGTTTKRLNTGSVNTIKSEDISRQPVSDPLQALEAQAPGLLVTQRTGLPGSSLKVQLRGRTALDQSLTDDQPLFIIDGVPYAPNNGFLNTIPSALGVPTNSAGATAPGGLSPFNSIDPQDIESIEILKDADATAIYGSRGASGVILITTKRGKPGRTAFNFNIQTGVSQATRTMSLLNTAQYLQMRHEAFANDSISPTPSNAYDFLLWDTTRNTDFTKLLIGGTGHTTDVQGSVSGGSANTQFLVGAGYHNESTVFPGDFSDIRNSVHFNLNHASTDQRFKLSVSASYSHENNSLLNKDLTGYLNLPPNFQLYDSAKKLAWNEGGIVSGYDNPLAVLNQKYSAKTDNLLGNLLLSYRLFSDLTVRVSGGYNMVILNESQIFPLNSQNPLLFPERSSQFGTNSFKSWIVEPQAEYVKSFGKNKIDILLGSSFQNQDDEFLSNSGLGYPDDALLYSLNGATSVLGSKSASQYRYEAFFGRINYNYSDKYILNISARRDGSSKFAPAEQFANFGSLGAAWIFSNERLFQNHFQWLSFGKLRASYGTTGNDKIPNYQYLDTWMPTLFPYQDGTAISPTKLYNPDYRWEQTKKFEAGLDLGFMKDRLVISIDFYLNQSSNQLIQYKMPYITGFASVVRNFPALVRNQGIEFLISSTNFKTKDFTWTSTFNLTIPSNELVSFPNLANSSYANQYVVGQPLNVIYRYKYLAVDPGTGLFTMEDLNKDGKLNKSDYQPLGTTDPVFYGGLSNSVRFKQFQLDFLFQFVKQKGLNYWGNLYQPPGNISNYPNQVMGRWTRPGDVTQVQKFTRSFGPTYDSFSDFQSSNGVYSDASFVRLKNISLSYNLPKDWLDKIHFASSRIYVTGQNLFTITNFEGADPETQNFLRLPPLTTFVAGIQFTF